MHESRLRDEGRGEGDDAAGKVQWKAHKTVLHLPDLRLLAPDIDEHKNEKVEMSKPANVRKWEQMVADYGCVVTREKPVQLHHVFGRTYTQDKILIGPWYILPLTHRLHDVGSNNQFNVTHWPKRFAIEFGYQRDLFQKMCETIQRNGQELPFDGVVLAAIGNSPLR